MSECIGRPIPKPTPTSFLSLSLSLSLSAPSLTRRISQSVRFTTSLALQAVFTLSFFAFNAKLSRTGFGCVGNCDIAEVHKDFNMLMLHLALLLNVSHFLKTDQSDCEYHSTLFSPASLLLQRKVLLVEGLSPDLSIRQLHRQLCESESLREGIGMAIARSHTQVSVLCVGGLTGRCWCMQEATLIIT